MSANLLHHPSNSLLGGGGDERFSRRGCKPQTNYTPTLNTAGRMTRKNILFGGVRWPGKHYIKCMVRHPPVSPFAAVGGVTWAALPQFLLFCRVLNTSTEHFLVTPALTAWKNKTSKYFLLFLHPFSGPASVAWRQQQHLAPKLLSAMFFFHPLMSMGPINISGKPTDQKWLLDSCPSGRKRKKKRKKIKRDFLFFLLKKKESDKFSKKRRAQKSFESEKNRRGRGGAAERKREGRRKYRWRAIIRAISGRLLFHPPAGMEGTGRVCLAAGSRRVERRTHGGRKRKEVEVNEWKGCLNHPAWRGQQDSTVPEVES